MILEKKRDVLIHSFTALKLIIHSCCCRCPFELGFVILPLLPVGAAPSAKHKKLHSTPRFPALSFVAIAASLGFSIGVIVQLDSSPYLKRAVVMAVLGARLFEQARQPLSLSPAASHLFTACLS
jgi:hypothetical protein